MFVTNHVLAGLAIGVRCRARPGLAFVLGFASHLPMDHCRHWGGREGGIHDPVFVRAAVADGCVALGVLTTGSLAARWYGRAGVPPVVAAALGAAVLDIDKPARLLLGRNPVPSWLQRLHEGVQAGVEAPGHLRRELVWAAALAAMAFAGLNGRSSPSA